MLNQVDLLAQQLSSHCVPTSPPLCHQQKLDVNQLKIIVNFREGNQKILSLVVINLICPNLSTDFSHGKCGNFFLSTDNSNFFCQ